MKTTLKIKTNEIKKALFIKKRGKYEKLSSSLWHF